MEDVALVDELRHLLGEPPEEPEQIDDPLAHLVDANLPELTTMVDREFAGPRATRHTDDDTYAHVLVDEAQDLTPMQWRMLGRRGRTATWTVVGDPAQSSWPFPAEADQARDEALGRKPRYRYHLDTNYRNSAEIYRFAAQYAERVGLAIDLPDAVRSTGVEPAVLADTGDVRATTAKEVDRMLGELEGTVAVVAAEGSRAAVRGWFEGPPRARRRRPGPARGADRAGDQGPGVRRHRRRRARGDRVGVADRPGHPVRRPDPGHPAADACVELRSRA